MATFKTVLLSPLPRAHDETPSGVVPMDREEHAIGLNSMPEGLSVAASEMTTSIQGRVVTPLEEWLNEYRKAKVRIACGACPRPSPARRPHSSVAALRCRFGRRRS